MSAGAIAHKLFAVTLQFVGFRAGRVQDATGCSGEDDSDVPKKRGFVVQKVKTILFAGVVAALLQGMRQRTSKHCHRTGLHGYGSRSVAGSQGLLRVLHQQQGKCRRMFRNGRGYYSCVPLARRKNERPRSAAGKREVHRILCQRQGTSGGAVFGRVRAEPPRISLA